MDRQADIRLHAAVDTPPHSAEPEPSLNTEDAVAVHAGLDRLPSPRSEVLTHFFLEDLTINEIATVLDIPPDTVKSRLHHAKKALKAILSKGVNGG